MILSPSFLWKTPCAWLCLCFLSLFLSACAALNGYKIDVQQGSVLTTEMVAQLQVGQTKDQVRFLLGTPAIKDAFHANRWDYVYSYRKGNSGETELRHLSIYFDSKNLLSKTDGDIDVEKAKTEEIPANRARTVDLSSLSKEDAVKPLAPREPPSAYQRFMDSLGF